MSYHIYIQRFDDTKTTYIDYPLPISPEEWQSIIESDQELEVYNNMPDTVAWIGDPEHGVDGYQRIFWYSERRQCIVTKNVESEEVITKMREIAAKLQAHVIGEEGEEDWDWDISNI